MICLSNCLLGFNSVFLIPSSTPFALLWSVNSNGLILPLNSIDHSADREQQLHIAVRRLDTGMFSGKGLRLYNHLENCVGCSTLLLGSLLLGFFREEKYWSLQSSPAPNITGPHPFRSTLMLQHQKGFIGTIRRIYNGFFS